MIDIVTEKNKEGLHLIHFPHIRNNFDQIFDEVERQAGLCLPVIIHNLPYKQSSGQKLEFVTVHPRTLHSVAKPIKKGKLYRE